MDGMCSRGERYKRTIYTTERWNDRVVCNFQISFSNLQIYAYLNLEIKDIMNHPKINILYIAVLPECCSFASWMGEEANKSIKSLKIRDKTSAPEEWKWYRKWLFVWGWIYRDNV